MSEMNIGQLIRKWRCANTGDGDIMMPCNEMLRILDAADLGLHLQLTTASEIEKYSKALMDTRNELRQVSEERTQLRQEYVMERQKIKDLGFKDLKEILYWVDAAKLQNIKVKPREES